MQWEQVIIVSFFFIAHKAHTSQSEASTAKLNYPRNTKRKFLNWRKPEEPYLNHRNKNHSKFKAQLGTAGPHPLPRNSEDTGTTLIRKIYNRRRINCFQAGWICVKYKRLCSFARLEFVLDDGNLKHTLSGKCVQPMGAIADGVALGLYSSCGGHQFSFTTGGSLQHVGSKKCVNTKSGVCQTFYF